MNALPLSIATIPPGFFIILAAVIGGLALAAAVTLASLYFQHQRQRLWHETARVALEKGQPVPPPPDNATRPSDPSGRRSMRRDLRAGLVLLATGIGLYLWFAEAGGRGPRFMGAIPALIGVALLLNGLITFLTMKKPADTTSQEP